MPTPVRPQPLAHPPPAPKLPAPSAVTSSGAAAARAASLQRWRGVSGAAAAALAAGTAGGRRRARAGGIRRLPRLARRCGPGASCASARRIFTARTLDLEDIQVIGYDLDYTLVHYNVEAWEGAVYDESKRTLRNRGFNVDALQFDPKLVGLGLVIDKRLGNIVKVDSFGYIRKAMRGVEMLSEDQLSTTYGPTVRVDLRDERWEFLNTLFSTASACLFCQLVDRSDGLEETVCVGDPSEAFGPSTRSCTAFGTPAELFDVVSSVVSETHVAGVLKARILADPSTYVQLEEEAALALLDQKLCGKRLVMITNNDWEYVSSMMAYAYDRFLPAGWTWRSLFDLVITNAQKPDFWTLRLPCWQVVDEERGLASSKPVPRMQVGGVYCGGSARLVEDCFGCYGEEVMYVGDHIYSDTNVAKSSLRWRTCLVMRELEAEVRGLVLGQRFRAPLLELLARQDELRTRRGELLARSARRRFGIPPRRGHGGGEGEGAGSRGEAAGALEDELAALEGEARGLMARVAELDGAMGGPAGSDASPRWGFLTRVGMHGKSHLMRQVEKYADIYTSRVSNFLACTPHALFRAPLQSDRNFLTLGEEGCQG